MPAALKSFLKFLFFLSLGCLILYFLYQSQNANYIEDCKLKGIPLADCSLVDKIIADFKSTNLIWLLIVCILFMVTNLFRVYRWRDMVNSLGYQPRTVNIFSSIMIGYFANLAIPRIGEFIRAGVISKYDDINFETSFGAIVLERLVDVLMLLIAITLMIILGGPRIMSYLEENSVITTQQIIYLAIFGLICLGIGIYVYRRLVQAESQNKIVNFIQSKIAGFSDGINSIRTVENKGMFWLYSFGIWIGYFLMTWLAFFSFGPTSDLGPVSGLVSFVFGGLGIVFPSPGGLGSYHFMVSQSLMLYEVNPADAFSFAFILFFTISIFCNVFFGLLSLILLPLFNR